MLNSYIYLNVATGIYLLPCMCIAFQAFIYYSRAKQQKYYWVDHRSNNFQTVVIFITFFCEGWPICIRRQCSSAHVICHRKFNQACNIFWMKVFFPSTTPKSSYIQTMGVVFRYSKNNLKTGIKTDTILKESLICFPSTTLKNSYVQKMGVVCSL